MVECTARAPVVSFAVPARVVNYTAPTSTITESSRLTSLTTGSSSNMYLLGVFWSGRNVSRFSGSLLHTKVRQSVAQPSLQSLLLNLCKRGLLRSISIQALLLTVVGFSLLIFSFSFSTASEWQQEFRLAQCSLVLTDRSGTNIQSSQSGPW